jgi:hypothetical protein
MNHSGAVYLFQRGPEGWLESVRLKALDPKPAAQFGYAVALSEDAVLVGSPGESTAGTEHPTGTGEPLSGAVYVFERASPSAGAIRLKSNRSRAHDGLGEHVAAVSNTLVAGAPKASLSPELAAGAVAECGAAFVFERNDESWSDPVAVEDPSPAPHRAFGGGLALAHDTLIVGGTGQVLAFRRDAGSWLLRGQLAVSEASDGFGQAVALDSGTLVVGAPNSDAVALEGGAVFVW